MKPSSCHFSTFIAPTARDMWVTVCSRGYCGGVGQATAKSMILNMVLVHLIGMMGSQIFWGQNPRAPIGG